LDPMRIGAPAGLNNWKSPVNSIGLPEKIAGPSCPAPSETQPESTSLRSGSSGNANCPSLN
jgi:hypothetical protein